MAEYLVYDSACGPCRAFKRGVAFLDPRRSFTFVGIREAQARGTLDGVPDERRWRSFHVVSEAGAVSGADALPSLVRHFPAGALLSRALTECAPLRGFASFAYAALARLHDRGSCPASPAGGSTPDGALNRRSP